MESVGKQNRLLLPELNNMDKSATLVDEAQLKEVIPNWVSRLRADVMDVDMRSYAFFLDLITKTEATTATATAAPIIT